MKQVFMRKRTWGAAQVSVEEVPAPALLPGSVVLATRHSLISAGTEMSAVTSTKKDMIVKALATPALRESVQEMLANQGVSKTLERIHYELTKWTALGYSGAGVAVEVDSQVDGIRSGDLVAYGGQPHAEYVRVPRHLCVPVPAGVSSEEAAFVALGSIALHAVRRTEPQVGDFVVVLGLGLVGQLVAQLLRLTGARVIGVDLLEARRELARKLACDVVLRAGGHVAKEVLELTSGRGADRVVICAAAAGRQVVEQAAAMARDRARLVVVGQVELDLPRHIFYMKELDLVVSRSYGPGRYDRDYEQHGHDYPIGYVRWTEHRNMAEFLRLVQERRIDVKSLITHVFDVGQAAEAYHVLRESPSSCLGVLLHYSAVEAPSRVVPVQTSRRCRVAGTQGRIGVIGCGSFARQFYLPMLKRERRLQFKVLVSTTGQSSAEMARRYGAASAATETATIWNDPDVDGVMVFTRDNTHAELVQQALRAGKHVFCEKPLAVTWDECRKLRELAPQCNLACVTGFNRRFAPMVRKVYELLSEYPRPKLIIYRVNAGKLGGEAWAQDGAYARGRIVGEACHFVDLFRFLTAAEPCRVTASAIAPCPAEIQIEDVSATIEFADGSVATLIYTALGSTSTGKERCEIYAGGTSILLDDFRSLVVRGRTRLTLRQRLPDKGHAALFAHWRDVLLGRLAPQISLEDGIVASEVCLAILKSARTQSAIDLSSPIDGDRKRSNSLDS